MSSPNINSATEDAIATSSLVAIPANLSVIAPITAALPQVVAITPKENVATNQTMNILNVTSTSSASKSENISAENNKTNMIVTTKLQKMDNNAILKTGCQIKVIPQTQKAIIINKSAPASYTPPPPPLTALKTNISNNYQIHFEESLIKNTNSTQKSDVTPLTATRVASGDTLENRDNLRKWSEALAHAKSVQISDSVVLSVAKSSSNKAKIIPNVTINEKSAQEPATNSYNNNETEEMSTLLAEQEQQLQDVVIMKNNKNDKTKQESLLKSKNSLDSYEETTDDATMTFKSNANSQESPILSPNNNRAKRAVSVNNPPIATENEMDNDDEYIDLFDLEKMTKKLDLTKCSTERRYSMLELSDNRTVTAFHKRNNMFKKQNEVAAMVHENLNIVELAENQEVFAIVPTLKSLSTAAVIKKTIQAQDKYANDDDAEDEDDDVVITVKEQIPVVNLDSDEEDMPEDQTKSATDQLNDQLLCYENIVLNTSSESNFAANEPELEQVKEESKQKSNKIDEKNKNLLKSSKPAAPISIDLSQDVNTYSTAVDILSTFNMLTWRDRIGSARGSDLRFQLNEFNLLQMFEYDSSNQKLLSPSVLEVPLYERHDTLRCGPADPSKDLTYTCRRCRCTGHQREFFAPAFCSIQCLSNHNRERRRLQRDAQVDATAKQTKSRYGIKKRTHSPSRNSNTTTINSNSSNNATSSYYNTGNLPTFRWSHYLNNNYLAAPINLFLNPFPTGPNNFEINMKLEAIDPENCSLFCVCSVVDKAGYRIKLSFDGYDSIYDFWVNADSMDIFPPGWCQKTGRVLQPPKGTRYADFNWQAYLYETRCTPAPRNIFTHLNTTNMPSNNPFEIGMHLEAEDLNDTGKLCVATVADVLNDRLRIHFDGWDDCYDYWVDINSPYIHPVGWHEGNNKIVPPPGYTPSSFNWKEYIRRNGGIAAPAEFFSARAPIAFKPPMKLEVVDQRLPSLIRPATVVARKGHRIKLHLDLWPNMYCFWLEDDSPDLHPIGWCDATGHELEPPPTYKMRHQRTFERSHFVGCRNVGNAKNPELSTHQTLEECPYATDNWRFMPNKPKRVTNVRIVGSNNNNISYTQKNIKSERTSMPGNDDKGSSMKRRFLEDTIFPKQEVKAVVDDPAKVKIESTPSHIVVAKEFLCDYGPRLQQSFDLWQHQMASVSSNIATTINNIHSNPLGWNTIDVARFVERVLKSHPVANIFIQQDIDGGALLQLQTDDLTDILQLSLGPAIKLFSHILQLRAICVYKFQNSA